MPELCLLLLLFESLKQGRGSFLGMGPDNNHTKSGHV
jgi:hypothetical protein